MKHGFRRKAMEQGCNSYRKSALSRSKPGQMVGLPPNRSQGSKFVSLDEGCRHSPNQEKGPLAHDSLRPIGGAYMRGESAALEPWGR